MEQIPSLISRKKKWFEKKEPKLKISILKKTAIEGAVSKTYLEKNLRNDKNYASSTISEVVDELASMDNNFLQRKKTIPKHLMRKFKGQPQKYYILTEKAIDFLIECEYLEINEFWLMLINIFDLEIYGTKIKQKNQKSNNKYINELISKYEKLKLKTSRECIFPENQNTIITLFKSEKYESHFSYWAKDLYFGEEDISESIILDEFRKIINILAVKGKIKKNKLFKKITKNKELQECVLNQLEIDGLTISINNENEISLSPTGILIAIFYRHEQYKHTTSSKNSEENKKNLKKLSKDMKKIILKNLDLLPLIFKNWKIMEREIGIFRLTGLFGNFFYDVENDKLMWGNTSGLRLLSTQKSMESIYRTQLRLEGYSGIYQLYKWKKENNSELPINEKDYFFLGENDYFPIIGRFPNKQRIEIKVDKKLNFEVTSFADEQHDKLRVRIDTLMHQEVQKFLNDPENFQKELFLELVTKIVKNSNIQEKEETVKGTIKAFEEILKIFRIKEPLIALINIENYAHTAELDIFLKLEFTSFEEFLEDESMNAAKNVISFQFFTIIFSNIPELWNKILMHSMNDNVIISSWYENWIHEIKRFNEDNIYEIKQLKIN